MTRILLSMSTFGFAAAAGVAAVAIRPLTVAGVAIATLALCYAAVLMLRDAEIEADAHRKADP